jgi:hypothetical protein
MNWETPDYDPLFQVDPSLMAPVVTTSFSTSQRFVSRILFSLPFGRSIFLKQKQRRVKFLKKLEKKDRENLRHDFDFNRSNCFFFPSGNKETFF